MSQGTCEDERVAWMKHAEAKSANEDLAPRAAPRASKPGSLWQSFALGSVQRAIESPGERLDSTLRAQSGTAPHAAPTATTGALEPASAPAEREAEAHAERAGAGGPIGPRSILEDLHIHRDAHAAAAADALDAEAVTVGRHVLFGSGFYAPQSIDGRALIAHEAAHAAQASAHGSGAVFRQRRRARGQHGPPTFTAVISNLNAALRQMAPPSFTTGEHDLLDSCIALLNGFFPSGYGTLDASGAVTRTSRAHAVQLPVRIAGSGTVHYSHNIELYLSDQTAPGGVIGRYQAGAQGGTITIFNPSLAGQSTDDIAVALVHEIVHLMTDVLRHGRLWAMQQRGRSPQSVAAAGAATPAPTPSLPPLNVSRADPTLGNSPTIGGLTGRLVTLYLPIIQFINQERRARNAAPLNVNATSYAWIDATVDEMLAYVFADDVALALATAANTGAGARVTMGTILFDPNRFFMRYALAHWIDPADRQSVQTSGMHLLTEPQLHSTLRAIHTEVATFIRR